MDALNLGVADILVAIFLDASRRPVARSPSRGSLVGGEAPEGADDADRCAAVHMACKCVAEIAGHKKVIKVGRAPLTLGTPRTPAIHATMPQMPHRSAPRFAALLRGARGRGR